MRFALQHILASLVTLGVATNAIAGEAPKRVVSLNVCTDQLAILLASPGQLYSVSFLATDPKSSLLHEEAKAYLPNNGLAEEIFLMKPDLILAGTFTTRSTVSMLRDLGFKIEEFAPETSVQEVKNNIKRLGALLGNQRKADQMLKNMDERLASLKHPDEHLPLAAFYYSNSYTSGAGTIMSDIAQLAGLRNLGQEAGLYGTAYLPLEQLILSKPDLMVSNEVQEDKPALAQQNFQHPAYEKLLSGVKGLSIDGRVTACGGPFTIDAIEKLNAAALKLRASQPQ